MAKNILVFSGTIDGRKLIYKLLRQGFLVTASSLTEYGNNLVEEHPLLTKKFGALGQKEIEDFIETHSFDMVIDATHPYAQEISQNIFKACQIKKKAYVRRERKKAFKAEEGIHFKTMQEACVYLNDQEGNILFTTGSNSISQILDLIEENIRLFFRILPIERSISVAKQCGLADNNIIALNPPFTVEENIHHIKEHAIRYIVTKDSGIDGGCLEKAEAARRTKINLVVIDRPNSVNKDRFYSDEKIIEKIHQL